MSVADLLLLELDDEIKKTRSTLARVPADKADFTPHPQSMPLGRLAPLVAQLAEFGTSILTQPELDFDKGAYKPLKMESAEQLVRAFDEGAAKTRKALTGLPDAVWNEPWKLSGRGKTIFEGSRFQAYRDMFLNHLVHHRAQLGVYLRMNGQAVPAVYGPSADEA